MDATTRSRTRPRFRIGARPAEEPVLPYEIRHWDTGAKAHLIEASGELDLHAAGGMREALDSLAARGRTHVLIDMSGATFIDSAMIGVLAGHLRNTREDNGSLSIVCSDENILRTFEIAGIGRELAILNELSDTTLERVATMPRPDVRSKLLAAPRPQIMRLRPEASQLALARGFAVAAARRVGLDPRQQYSIAVAAHEAVANAIEHGRPGSDGSIELWVSEGPASLTVGVRDSGDFALKPLPPDPLHERGRGLRMMSQMVDHMSVQREDAQTVVRLSIER